MTKQFWQCDVTDREDNIWTGPVIYGSHQEAEFATMLELRADWGADYLPDAFNDAFPENGDEGVDWTYPGDETWNTLGFWDELSVNTFMLALDPAVALAKLGKLECHLTEPLIEKIVNGEVRAEIGLII
jgi:hypothetical protein